MSLSDLRTQIKDEAQRAADEIRQKARQEAAAVVESARQQAGRKIDDAVASAKASLVEEESEGRTAAALEAKKMLSEAREAAVASALEEVRNQLSEVRANGVSYSALLRRLAEEGCNELGTRKVRVLASRNDHKYLKGWSLEHADIPGGAIVETTDGKVRSDKSFDALFSQYKDEMRRQLYAMMFRESKQEGGAKKSAKRSKPKTGKKRGKK